MNMKLKHRHRTITPEQQQKMQKGKFQKDLERMYAYDIWEADCALKEAEEEEERRAYEQERMENMEEE
jgi:hypothetical protein